MAFSNRGSGAAPSGSGAQNGVPIGFPYDSITFFGSRVGGAKIHILKNPKSVPLHEAAHLNGEVFVIVGIGAWLHNSKRRTSF
jgi:hypothetical protein